jgi:hypothetical protein
VKSPSAADSQEGTEQLAYYYPQPYWQIGEADWMKSLLLFFDRVAILLPRYMRGREVLADPIVAGPLSERGLLEVLEPESFVNLETAEALSTIVGSLLASGAFEGLDRSVYYQELSHSRLGWNADVRLAKGLLKDLRKHGLAAKSRDGLSAPLHPTVRTTVLVLLSQLARRRGIALGYDLEPITMDIDAISSLLATLALPAMPSAGHIVALDLETIGLNLAPVSLDEVLEFRKEHGGEYKRYARDVREAIRELSSLPPDLRAEHLLDRREGIADRAFQLRRTAMRSWRRPLASISLGAAGAVWSAAHGDVISAALSLAAGAIGASEASFDAGAYSYLFAAGSMPGAEVDA